MLCFMTAHSDMKPVRQTLMSAGAQMFRLGGLGWAPLLKNWQESLSPWIEN